MVIKLKKYFIILLLFLMCGCYLSTPTKEVESYFNKYQTDYEKVISDMSSIIDMTGFNDKQKEEYKNILKKHYLKLEYKIKDEVVNANKAVVTVEIEVIDYSKILNEVSLYKEGYEGEFLDSFGNYSESKFIDYKLSKLKDAMDKVKYTLDISLTKIDNKWYIDELSREYKEKINGIYNY